MLNSLAKTPEAKTLTNVENHRKAAEHLELAARHHKEALRHFEAGTYDKAYQNTVLAHRHTRIATDHQKEVIQHLALKA